MPKEIMDAFKKVIDRNILNVAYEPLSSFIDDNIANIDLTYGSNAIETVDQASLIDFELIKVADVNQSDDTLIFQIVVCAEIEIEETIHRNREVDCVQKWFILVCTSDIDDIQNSFKVKSIRVY